MLDATPTIEQSIVDKLRRSLRIQDPNIETDPVYQYSDFDLWEIFQDAVPEFSPNDTFSTLDAKYYHVVNILARKEVLWRLALDTAPYYRLEAEGASLEKNMRFDHYFKLIALANEEYSSVLTAMGGRGLVESYDVTTSRNHNSIYNYERSSKPTIVLTLSNITSSSVNLDWTKFDVLNGKFYGYKLYISTSPIVDLYAETEIPVNCTYTQLDIHKLKHRFTNLTPSTLYYVCVVSMDTNGIYGYAEESFTTLPAS